MFKPHVEVDVDAAPQKIYLQLGAELDEDVTWCQDRINHSDVEYVRADFVEGMKERPDNGGTDDE